MAQPRKHHANPATSRGLYDHCECGAVRRKAAPPERMNPEPWHHCIDCNTGRPCTKAPRAD